MRTVESPCLNSLHPWLNHVLIPLGEDRRLEHHRVGLHQAASRTASAANVDGRVCRPDFRTHRWNRPLQPFPSTSITYLYSACLAGSIHSSHKKSFSKSSHISGFPHCFASPRNLKSNQCLASACARAEKDPAEPGARGSSSGEKGSSTLPDVKGTVRAAASCQFLHRHERRHEVTTHACRVADADSISACAGSSGRPRSSSRARRPCCAPCLPISGLSGWTSPTGRLAR